LLFGYKDDPAFRRHVTLPDNREAPAALHLELPKSELKPTLLGLHYVHGMHRRATTAYYMLSGALEVHETPGFEYTRMKKKTASLTQLSEFLYTLNTPVAALDYPKGRKLAVVDILKKLDVHYVGDLVRKSEDELKAALGQTHWLTVRSLLKNLKLAAGVPIPQWRRPSVK
jgi:hypothetical protein